MKVDSKKAMKFLNGLVSDLAEVLYTKDGYSCRSKHGKGVTYLWYVENGDTFIHFYVYLVVAQNNDVAVKRNPAIKIMSLPSNSPEVENIVDTLESYLFESYESLFDAYTKE